MTDDRHQDAGAANAPRDPRHDPAMPAPPPSEAIEESTKPEPRHQEPNPWLREGTDAPDAADIEDPDTQL